jgi:hypothetical protein
MAIVQTLNFSQFCDAFRTMQRNENFSYAGKQVLFDYLEEYSDSTGEPVELDIIALCCDYEENDYETIAENYSIDVSEAEGEDEVKEIVMDYLKENTIIVGEVPCGFVYAQF